MPIYEFYCDECNTIFSFLSRKINTSTIPPCPNNSNHKLSKMVSHFAITGSTKIKSEESNGIPDIPIDESKMEKAIETLASEAENINEDNPKEAVKLVRKLSDMTGLRFGDKIEEALNRIESGEDPEVLEEELGDINENELFSSSTSTKIPKKYRPFRDETLYEM